MDNLFKKLLKARLDVYAGKEYFPPYMRLPGSALLPDETLFIRRI